MLAACEVGEVFALLEGGTAGSRDAAETLFTLYGVVREPWLVRALLLYHARTNSSRVIELLARAPEIHARYLLDMLLEDLRGELGARHTALAALAPLLSRRPPWMHRISSHGIARELPRTARAERDALPLLHALLALAVLLPAAPSIGAVQSQLQDMVEAMIRPMFLEPPPTPPTRAHLHLAQLALFRSLYATHPCTLVEVLRTAGNDVGGARDIWERGIASLACSVRLHPALIIGPRLPESDLNRWAKVETHDVVAEAHRLSITSRDEPAPSPQPVPSPAPPSQSPAPGSGAHAARAASALRPGAEPWFPLVDRCGADSAPPTPLPADADTAEPPEAAVEATPENTPARETRAQFKFPPESGAVRAIGRRSRGPSPPRKETSPAGDAYSGRLARVALERRAADSPVSFAGAPPAAGVARPEPSRPAGPDTEPLNVEDREVLELTRRSVASDDWPGPEMAERERMSIPDPRRHSAPARRSCGSAPGRAAPPRRPSSCDRAGSTRRSDAAVQTVDTWPEPYEFIISDFYRTLPEETVRQGETGLLGDRLDTYLGDLYAGRTAGAGIRPGDVTEQLMVLHAQLMYERWRREAHAERNRRLLGRCRQVRALELRNHALQDRVLALTRERDELRQRLAREPAPPPPAAPPGAESRDELAAERAARLRAEAALHEAEAARALDAAELQRQRADSFEAARHVEALARAALAAERRAEHVRRLRRELLLLAEREARLSEAVRCAAAPHPVRPALDERALRAACARAEAAAEAATARADAAAARAHELETALAARDATVAELKRATRAAAEEGAARLRALHDKYSALLRVVRATEARRLEWLAAAAPAVAQAVAPDTPTRS